MDKLNKYASHLVSIFQSPGEARRREGLPVNPIVSEVAVWYEKVRNAMEFREEEMVLRATIERILRRRLVFGGNGKTVAEPLLRELLWARYFTEKRINEEVVDEVAQAIDVFLAIRAKILERKLLSTKEANEWTYDLLSAHIERMLGTNVKREAMVNFMYHVMRSNISLEGDSSEVCDVQTYIAVRRAFAKNDRALLRYHLFLQYFGQVTPESVEKIVEKFKGGYKEIEAQLSYPARYSFYSYVKKLAPPFFILYDVLLGTKDIERVVSEDGVLEGRVDEVCAEKYRLIVGKVHRGIIRSIIFILMTKTFFAVVVEGSYERAVYGSIQWLQVGLNIAIPTVLMASMAIFLRAPGKKNTELIYQYINELLYESDPQIGRPIVISKHGRKKFSPLYAVFTFLWLASFVVSFGLVIYILQLLHFNIVSNGVFLFFFVLVIFLAYRIRQTAREYTVRDEGGVFTPIVDFFFMPFARVGRWITDGVSQVNILLIVVDYLIETPFKALFAFFEQWFFFISSKREQMD